ncbi:MAG: amidohydrolase family protein [Bacteroidota bacterium]
MTLTRPFYNCHIHTFSEQDIPVDFFKNKILMDFLKRHTTEELAADLIGFIHKIELLLNINAEEAEKYLQFYLISKMNSQRQIFDRCRRGYPDGSKFFVLAMDMAFMQAGNVPRNYIEQLRELSQVNTQQIIPFVHIDPRREGYFQILREAVETLGFKGVKLYPPLGVFPFDERLDRVYEYCVDHNLPVVSHGSPHNPVHFKGSEKDLLKLLENKYFEVNPKGLNFKELCDIFTHPKNYAIVCEKNPLLKICIAHYGSSSMWEKRLKDKNDGDNWVNIINRMIQKYRYFYTDISYTMYFDVKKHGSSFYKEFSELLDNDAVRRKVLFGSDYFMPASQETDMTYAQRLCNAIGPEKFNAIAVENPEAFLR